MVKRRVYTLYGDVEALKMVIERLVENSFAFITPESSCMTMLRGTSSSISAAVISRAGL